MGTTDQGTRLRYGLNNTIKAGARTTLIEGFPNAAEGAAVWRSGDPLYYDYPNQRINIVRSFSKKPYPDTLKVEVEACDFHYDMTNGNSGGAFLHEGNLDVLKCTDKWGGWHVTNTQANEWMEWKELPLLKDTKFQLRYKSTTASSIKFTVNENDLQIISLPSTSGVWNTVDAGTFSTTANSANTVKLTIVSGTPDINYFQRVANTVSSIGDGNVTTALQPLMVSVSPNPYQHGIISVNLSGFENDTDIMLKIYSLSGQVVYQQSLNNSSKAELDLSGKLAKSIYVFSVEAGNHKALNKLIIK